MSVQYRDLPLTPSAARMTVSDAEAVSESLFRLLTTNKGELFDEPEYGASLRRYVYEPLNDDTAVFIQMEVRRAVQTWEPRVELRDINVVADQERHSLTLSIIAYIPEFDTFVTIEPTLR